MSFDFVISSKLEKILHKLARKDKKLAIAIRKKMHQVTSCDTISIQTFKNLKGKMSKFKRVHIGSFVLVFRVKGNTIIFEDFTHHDDAYKR